MPCIYQITNIQNGKFYIGMTKHLQKRWKRHLYEAKRNKRHTILYHAMRKYGASSFVVTVLQECSLVSMENRERYWIKKLRPHYNMTDGGCDGKYSERKTPREKIALSKKRSQLSQAMWGDPVYRNTIIQKNTKPVMMISPRGTIFKLFKSPAVCAEFLNYNIRYIQKKALSEEPLTRGHFTNYHLCYQSK